MNKGFNFSKKIYRETTIKNVNTKLKLGGISDKITASRFLDIRFILTILSFILTVYLSEYGYILAPIIALIMYVVFPIGTLDYYIKVRERKLESEAMYFFEILTLSLESGRNLYNALTITVENIDSELSHAFSNALEEMKYGKNLDTVLENLTKTIPSDTINNIILNIRESNIFGNNIVETLYNQIDYLRGKQTFMIKEKINKIPVKISVISVIFYIPLIMLLILGPVVIKYILG